MPTDSKCRPPFLPVPSCRGPWRLYPNFFFKCFRSSTVVVTDLPFFPSFHARPQRDKNVSSAFLWLSVVPFIAGALIYLPVPFPHVIKCLTNFLFYLYPQRPRLHMFEDASPPPPFPVSLACARCPPPPFDPPTNPVFALRFKLVFCEPPQFPL